MALFERLRNWGRPAPSPRVGETYPDTERRTKPRVNARPGIRVLVVDDSATIVALLRKMLVQNSYEVIEVATAEAALESARSAPELIFLDIVLPDGDGFSVLRELRKRVETRDVPVIMMSGNAQATEQFYVQRIGADDFMKKPFARAEVFSRIEALLDAEHRPRRTAQRIGSPAELATLPAQSSSVVGSSP